MLGPAPSCLTHMCQTSSRVAYLVVHSSARLFVTVWSCIEYQFQPMDPAVSLLLDLTLELSTLISSWSILVTCTVLPSTLVVAQAVRYECIELNWTELNRMQILTQGPDSHVLWHFHSDRSRSSGIQGSSQQVWKTHTLKFYPVVLESVDSCAVAFCQLSMKEWWWWWWWVVIGMIGLHHGFTLSAPSAINQSYLIYIATVYRKRIESVLHPSIWTRQPWDKTYTVITSKQMMETLSLLVCCTERVVCDQRHE